MSRVDFEFMQDEHITFSDTIASSTLLSELHKHISTCLAYKEAYQLSCTTQQTSITYTLISTVRYVHVGGGDFKPYLLWHTMKGKTGSGKYQHTPRIPR